MRYRIYQSAKNRRAALKEFVEECGKETVITKLKNNYESYGSARSDGPGSRPHTRIVNDIKFVEGL